MGGPPNGQGKHHRRNNMPNHQKLREEQESPCGWVTRLVRRWRWSRRERDIIRNCGCVTYCPKCHDMLNDQAYWLASNGEGLGTYKCRLCGNVSEWHFGIAPVAVLIWGQSFEGETEKITETDWYLRRVNLLGKVQKHMRDPERTLVCDILANGQLLPDPHGKRYGFVTHGNNL